MNAVMTYASLPPHTRPATHSTVRPTGVGRLFVTTGELLISLGERTARRPRPDVGLLAAHADERRDLEARAHSALWP
ncbi:hypothetical protein [Arthrobacter sp. IK3]|uniref:hypothetical protein n=1 Tax=Arthrobacter sp. IK3 TaxID=3448169 RepID=UPI003EDEC176